MVEPLQGLLDRDAIKKEAGDLIKIIDLLLTEEVNRATQLVWQVQEATAKESGTTPRDDVNIATTLFLHIVEVTDGIHMLLKEVCTDAAAPLLRSLFEGMLNLRFIVNNIDDKDVVTAWYVNSLRQRRKYMDGFSSDDEKVTEEVSNEVERLNKRLNEDYKEITAKIGKQNWYAPYGGGGNLKELAEKLEFGRGVHLLQNVECQSARFRNRLPT